MKLLHMVSFILVVVGGVNWALVALFDTNLVTMLFGSIPGLVTLVYVLIGVGALYLAYEHKNVCTYCSGKKT